MSNIDWILVLVATLATFLYASTIKRLAVLEGRVRTLEGAAGERTTPVRWVIDEHHDEELDDDLLEPPSGLVERPTAGR